jgi:hypothetical protein
MNMKLAVHNACTVLLLSGLLRTSASFQAWPSGLMSKKENSPSDNILDGRRRLHDTSLKMGAFDKRNKQADLLAKMKEAKDKKSGAIGDDKQEFAESGPSSSLTAKEMKEIYDRKRFEDLLNSDAATVAIMDEFGEDSYRSKSQEEEELSSSSSRRRASRKDRLFEGDQAPSEAFEHLLDATSGNPIGPKGTTKLLPWLGSSTSKKYIAILSDPRSKSTDLRESVQAIESSIPAGLLKNLIVINADSPLENKK